MSKALKPKSKPKLTVERKNSTRCLGSGWKKKKPWKEADSAGGAHPSLSLQWMHIC